MSPNTVLAISIDSARVYTKYHPEKPPPHPGNLWTRWVCISDTHSATFPVPLGDALIHAGDLMQWGELDRLITTIDWLKSLPHAKKFVIAGNHDELLDRSQNNIEEDAQITATARSMMLGPTARAAGLVYLEYESANFPTTSGVRPWSIYGSPATPRHGSGAFQYRLRNADEINSRIPDNVDILITHGPPHNILDRTRNGASAGCSSLTKRLMMSLPKCRLHVFGHIHEARGAALIYRKATSAVDDDDDDNDDETQGIQTVFINAAGQGRPNTQPIIVDLLKPIDPETSLTTQVDNLEAQFKDTGLDVDSMMRDQGLE